jgi:rod shape-determining protein MreB
MGAYYSLVIGYPTAIEIKEAIGSALPRGTYRDKRYYDVNGASLETGLPGAARITAEEIRERCLKPILRRYVRHFQEYLEYLQEFGEIHRDAQERYFYLTGGVFLLDLFPEYLARETGLNMVLVENPLTTVVDGLKLMAKDEKLLKLGIAA